MPYPYLVRSKCRPVKMRDGKTGVMKDIGPRAWVEFELLPINLDAKDTCDLYIRVPQSDEDMHAARADNARWEAEDSKRHGFKPEDDDDDAGVDDTPNLDSMTKAEIVEYASSIDLELDAAMKKDEMVEAVLSRLVEIDEG